MRTYWASEIDRIMANVINNVHGLRVHLILILLVSMVIRLVVLKSRSK